MKIVVIGNYGAKNLGDEMILEGLLSSLNNVYTDAEISVLSGDPIETAKTHDVKSSEKFPAGIKSFFRFFKSKTPKIVKNSDLVVLGGGGLFGSLSFHANIIWAIQALMAYYYKKPLVMYGQSISEIKNPILKKLIRKIFQKAEIIAMRDEKSIQHLKNLGVKKEIHLMPDLAVANELIPKTKKEKIAIIALREMQGLSTEFPHEIAKFINWLIESENYQIKIIDFQKESNSDATLSRKILNLTDSRKISYYPNLHNLQELYSHFQSANFVLGMRLHSIIAALKTHTPFLAISYHEKVTNLLETSGFQNYLNLDEINFENLKNEFKKISHSDTPEKMAQFTKAAAKKHRELEQVLRQISL